MTGRGDEPAGTLGDLLAEHRHRQFVGRGAEMDLFRSTLEGDDPQFSVLFIHGPGGVGKTSLLDEFAAIAGPTECLVRVDARDLGGVPAAVLDDVEQDLTVPDGDGPIMARHGGRVVLLVDGCERLGPVEGWLRERFLPRLPTSALVVMAGRLPPRQEWRADGAWSERLRVVSLRNFDPAVALTYLAQRRLPSRRHAEVVAVTHGHPLSLSLVADVLAREPDADLSVLPADIVSELLQRLVTSVPSRMHQRALEVSAVARTTTEGLLREVVGDAEEPRALFGWLAGLSITETSPLGVRPHDLVRDLLDADLRWRDTEGYREVFRAVRASAVEQVRRTTGHQQQRAIADLKFLFRNLRSVMSPVVWEQWGDYYPDPATPADHAGIVDLVGSAEGTRSAAVARHWLDRQPEAFSVIRGPENTIRGVIALLDLTDATTEDRAGDPGAEAAWDHVVGSAPARAGDVVTMCRFVVDAESYQAPSPTLNAVPILTMQRQFATPHLAWDFLALAEPDRWDEYFAAADLPRAVGADFTVDGRSYGLFAHDFRQVPVDVTTERWTERALADDALLHPATATEPELLVLSHPDFDSSVRQAFRDLHRPELLAGNLLVRTRLLHQFEGTGGAGLGALLRAAAQSLAEDPRDDKLFRAVDAAYLRRYRTQEAAAEALRMPFSTYRRHLRQGMDRIVTHLWRQELNGT